MYEYNAIVTDVYDGDTITVNIDLGFHSWLKKVKIRLYGINAPEVRGDEKEQGKITRDKLREMILDKSVIIKTYKDKKGKYGRWLAEVCIEYNDEIININQKLVADGYASEAFY